MISPYLIALVSPNQLGMLWGGVSLADYPQAGLMIILERRYIDLEISR